LYVRFIIPIFALALEIPIVRINEPFMLFPTNPNKYSTLVQILDFSATARVLPCGSREKESEL